MARYITDGAAQIGPISRDESRTNVIEQPLAQSVIVAPSGQIRARCITTGHEIAVATIDLESCSFDRNTLFDFDRYHQSQHFSLISQPREPRR